MDDDLFLFEDLATLSQSVLLVGQNRERNERPSVDPLADFSDRTFKDRYRMTKDSAKELLAIVEEHMPEAKSVGRRPLTNMAKLLITLRFLAEGCFLKTAGDCHGHSQSTVSRVVAEVCNALAKLSEQFIVFPTGSALADVSKGMYEMVSKRWPSAKAMPNVIGCIDGTQIRIHGHGLSDREDYRNRHGHVAINVQAICDHRLIFTNVVARWKGSTHDARIFANCKLQGQFERSEIKGCLLGDMGYPLRPYLLIPLANPVTAPEKAYQFAHVQTRNCVERAFGLLKRRFQVIGPDGGMLRLKLATALDAISACFVLHNFLRLRGDNFDVDGQALSAEPPALANLANGTSITDIRRQIINNFFS